MRQRIWNDDQISEMRLRHACGEPTRSIAKHMGTYYDMVRKNVDPNFMAWKRDYNRKWQLANKERLRSYNAQWKLKWFRQSRYGLSGEDVEQLLEKQKHECPICQCAIDRRAHVDHDHTTGKIRGLLCRICNVALGGFRDNPKFLEAAIRYLGVL